MYIYHYYVHKNYDINIRYAPEGIKLSSSNCARKTTSAMLFHKCKSRPMAPSSPAPSAFLRDTPASYLARSLAS